MKILRLELLSFGMMAGAWVRLLSLRLANGIEDALGLVMACLAAFWFYLLMVMTR